jgi:hypothetical protein
VVTIIPYFIQIGIFLTIWKKWTANNYLIITIRMITIGIIRQSASNCFLSRSGSDSGFFVDIYMEK